MKEVNLYSVSESTFLIKSRIYTQFTVSIGIFLFFLILYIVSTPGNQSELDDGYWYAYDIEAKSYTELFHHYHLLYLPTMKLLYEGAHAVSLVDRSFDFVVVITAISSSLALTFFFLLLRNRLGFEWPVAIIGTALLGFSYGFWRYSLAVDAYAHTVLLNVILLYAILSPQLTIRHGPSLSIIACSAIMMHTLSAALACVVVPTIMVTRRQYGLLVLYGMTSALTLFAAYFYAAQMTPDSEGSVIKFLTGNAPFSDGGFSWTNLPKSIIGFGQTLLAGTFLFGLPGFADWLARLVPTKMLEDVVFTAASAGQFPVIFGIITAAFLAALTVIILGRLTLLVSRRRAAFSVFGTMLGLGWFMAYLPMVILVNPVGIELWVIGLLPFWILVTSLIIQPLFDVGNGRLLVGLVMLLAVHNALAGLWMIHDPATSYYRAQAQWFLANTDKDDLIVSLDKEGFTRYVRYYAKAEVINLFLTEREQDLKQVQVLGSKILNWKGRVFMTESVVNPPPHVCLSSKDHCKAARRISHRLQDRVEVVENNEFGRVFKLLSFPSNGIHGHAVLP